MRVLGLPLPANGCQRIDKFFLYLINKAVIGPPCHSISHLTEDMIKKNAYILNIIFKSWLNKLKCCQSSSSQVSQWEQFFLCAWICIWETWHLQCGLYGVVRCSLFYMWIWGCVLSVLLLENTNLGILSPSYCKIWSRNWMIILWHLLRKPDGHFGCLYITFDYISLHFRYILHFYLF